ncbi:MAG: hypothetical protein NZ949_04990 [Candidatus Kapabacteria bacterium]|nr:hypothetical protein [Candidatus Kapabacteria bacterium]
MPNKSRSKGNGGGWQPRRDWSGRRIDRDPFVRAGYDKRVLPEGVKKACKRGIEDYRIIPGDSPGTLKRIAITAEPGPKGGKTVAISELRKPDSSLDNELTNCEQPSLASLTQPLQNQNDPEPTTTSSLGFGSLTSDPLSFYILESLGIDRKLINLLLCLELLESLKDPNSR